MRSPGTPGVVAGAALFALLPATVAWALADGLVAVVVWAAVFVVTALVYAARQAEH